jgi:hypothetical protein
LDLQDLAASVGYLHDGDLFCDAEEMAPVVVSFSPSWLLFLNLSSGSCVLLAGKIATVCFFQAAHGIGYRLVLIVVCCLMVLCELSQRLHA